LPIFNAKRTAYIGFMRFQTAMLLACPLILPGCIVGEIRDNLVQANEALGRVESQLQQVGETNAQVLEKPVAPKELLARVDAKLAN